MFKNSDRFDVLEIHYPDAVSDPLGQARRIRDFLGLKVSPDTMAAAVDESLYRNRG
jgi:hypothetical protein